MHDVYNAVSIDTIPYHSTTPNGCMSCTAVWAGGMGWRYGLAL